MAVDCVVEVGPRQVLVRHYDPNPWNGVDVAQTYELREFLEREDLHADVRNELGQNALAALLEKVHHHLACVPSIEATLAGLPVDDRLARAATDPRCVRGARTAAPGTVLDHSFVIGGDFVLAGGVRLEVNVWDAMTTLGALYILEQNGIAIIDRSGVVVDRCASPFDRALVELMGLHALGDLVFVGYAWASSQGARGYLRHERGRGWTARWTAPA